MFRIKMVENRGTVFNLQSSFNQAFHFQNGAYIRCLVTDIITRSQSGFTYLCVCGGLIESVFYLFGY